MDAPLNNSTIAAFACREVKWCQESFRDSFYIFTLILITIDVVLASVAFLGNGLILFVYYQNETLRIPSNTVLVGLAVTDFFFGAVAMPLTIYEKVMVLTNCTTHLCVISKIRQMVLIYLYGTTSCFLSITSLDRYIAILHSFRYLELVTNGRVTKLLLASLFLWIIVLVVSAFSGGHIILPAAIIVGSNVVFVAVLNVRIFREIRRLESNAVVANEAEEARKARERKTAQTVGIILGALFLCFVPGICVGFLRASLRSFKDNVLFDLILWAALTISNSNSSLNCFIYFWKNTEIRAAIVKVVRSATQRFRNGVSP